MSGTTGNEGFPAQPGEAPVAEEVDITESETPDSTSEDKPKKTKVKKADAGK